MVSLPWSSSPTLALKGLKGSVRLFFSLSTVVSELHAKMLLKSVPLISGLLLPATAETILGVTVFSRHGDRE